MRYLLPAVVVLTLLASTAAWAAEVSKEATDRLQQVNARAEKLAQTKVAEFAKDYLEAAKLSIFMAQAATAQGNERLVLQRSEMAQLQLTVAEAKATQKELSEEVALSRAELKRLEAQLERYMQPEEK